MKNRKIHIGLITLTLVLIAVNFIIDFRRGLSRADILNYSCEVMLVIIWIIGVIRSKSTQ